MHVSPSFRRAVPIIIVIGTIIFGGTRLTANQARRTRVIKLVTQIQRADYEGDRAALLRLYQDLFPFVEDKMLTAQVRYWRGFALWRRALNGFNESIERSALVADLQQAAREFEAALKQAPGFVDAKAAAASCLGTSLWLAPNGDQTQARATMRQALNFLNEAEAAEPDNPRVLWILGQVRWSMPPEHGGGQQRAIETNLKGLQAARKQRNATSDPLQPAWGEAELLMNLAWDYLNHKTPDLAKAEEYAQAALALVPHWHYVKDILLPQIAAAKSQSPGGKMQQDFFTALTQGDVAQVKALLQTNPQLAQAKDEKGVSAILKAAYYRKPDIVAVLLATGLELSIFEAAATGQSARVKALVKQDAQLANAFAADGFAPLGLATFFGHRATVEALLAAGADVNAASRESMKITPLHSAASARQFEIARLLIAHGADVNPLQAASGLKPLHEAAANGDLAIARLLLEHGADLNAKTHDGKTPLALALARNQTEMVAFLRERKAVN
ncbi:MAG: ankyrin repeat domain-containing protein [Acidobacteria bacterium]|nr:ankyrin repeat domain-containing protein [Acidobacteriota bacterium]